jgi:hypothetical protein
MPHAQIWKFLVQFLRRESGREPDMDEWKAISPRDALQRFLMLIVLCLAIVALIAAAVWYIA